MIYDYTELNKRILEVFGTQKRFANEIGLSEHSVSQKLNSKKGWKQKEIAKICGVLNIPHNQIASYFFTKKVQ